MVVGIDRLGRNAAEVMTTIGDLGEHGIVLRSLREGIDTPNAAGRMVAGVLASLAELELELGRDRRSAARDTRRARGQAIGRPKALDESKLIWRAECKRQRVHDELADRIRTCTLCDGMNVKNDAQSAPGFGSVRSPVVIVGQSLCEPCMAKAEPFLGGSGEHRICARSASTTPNTAG